MADNQQNGKATEDQTAIDPAEAEAADRAFLADRGQLIETFLSPRTFMSADEALALVVGKPRGWSAGVGTIAGYATSCERREVKPQPGQPAYPASLWIKGQFQAVVASTGEVKSSANLILPRAASDMIEQAFGTGATGLMLDLEVTVQATGRGIPYSWGVRAYGTRQSEADRVVQAIRARQEARAAQALPAPAKPGDPA